MINRRTVFVLGAGASFPYGFPTGEGLVNEIISLASNERTNDAFLYNGCVDKDVKRFARDLSDSDASSVDSFLEHRPDFLKIGKLAICLSLVPKEQDQALTREYRNASKRTSMAWYHYLWNAMAAPKGAFGKNEVSFVTLNYDRSLERYFFLRLRAKHQYDSDDECFEELYRIPFVHVYGSLGDERFSQDPFNRGAPSVEDVRRASERLRIIHEETTEAPYIAQAVGLLQKAHAICFLGYGFHYLNNQRLTLSELAKEDREPGIGFLGRKWFASRFGMTDVEFRRLTVGFRDRFDKSGNRLANVGSQNDGALEILRSQPLIE